MKQDRRSFLKTSGMAGAAAVAGASLSGNATAASMPLGQGELSEFPKGLTFASLKRDDGSIGLGIKRSGGVFDLMGAEQEYRQGAPTTMEAMLRGQGEIAAFHRLIDRSGETGKHLIALEKASFAPCVSSPEKIICIGLNYRKHAAETGNPVPKQPILFNKYNTALNCHGGVIAVSKEQAERFDYEAELVIIIGKQARNVNEANAKSHIFGYATGNDFTARDLQSRSSQWMLGKSLDGSAPLGPWIVTADQADGDNLKIECKVNGQVRQSSSTSDMVFNCSQLVSYISTYMTLKPGDLIFTGTPEGVISGYPKDKQVWLKAGDKVVTSIEKLGELEFTLT
jgi:2-keto-4-pentenoate hydratase/2-oxohepta-3-ene-1,7-dioic acid hydratase in catechol pathway